MFGIRGLEFVIILVVILLIFGPSKLPALAKSIGTAITNFKDGLNAGKDGVDSEASDKPDVDTD